MPNLIIGARGGKLGQYESQWAKDLLEQAHPGLLIDIEILSAAEPAREVEALHRALLERRVDLTVHDLSDLPPILPPALHLAAIPAREDAREVLLAASTIEAPSSLKQLPANTRIGVDTLRRAAQLRGRRPELQILPLPGELEPRLHAMEAGACNGLLASAAEAHRLGLASRIAIRIDPAELLPAANQGALGIAARVDDPRTNMLLEMLNHWPTRFAVEAERALLRELTDALPAPVAVWGRVENDGLLHLDACVSDAHDGTTIRRTVSGPPAQSEELGLALARDLLAAGARELRARPLPASATTAPAPMLPPPPRPEEKRATAPPTRSRGKKPTFNPIRGSDAIAPPGPPPAAPANRREAPAPTILPGGQTPLAGRRIILTRTPRQSGDLAGALRQLGAEVLPCPPVDIQAPASWDQLDRALIHLSWYDWLVFTSARGVEYFLQRLDELGHGRAELLRHRVCAIGRKTAEKLKGENMTVDLMPERLSVESVLETMLKTFGVRQRLRGARLLIPCARAANEPIRKGFERMGVYVEIVETFRLVLSAMPDEGTIDALRDGQADTILFNSPATVAHLAAFLETDHLAPLFPAARIAAIGPGTYDAVRLHGLPVHLQIDDPSANAILARLLADNE
ncbi:MAG: uroporphyrinogen-III synthase [Blastocatellia bacterium]|nr:uroporphyrinogen-III synthase [Blastocatellia bacterium]